jgi:hypothetical protein
MMPRRHFDAADGVAAVGRLALAEACYQSAELEEDASRVRLVFDEWREDVEREYRSHLLQLRRALAEERRGDVVATARALSRYLRDDPGKYREHLRELELQSGVAGKGKTR